MTFAWHFSFQACFCSPCCLECLPLSSIVIQIQAILQSSGQILWWWIQPRLILPISKPPAERLVSLSLSLPGLTVLLWASEGMSWDKHWISITSIQLQPRNSLMHNCLYIKINPSLDVLRVFCPCALITYYVPDIMHTLSQFSQQPCKNRLLHLTNEKTDSQKSKRHSAHFRFWDNYLHPCQIRLF